MFQSEFTTTFFGCIYVLTFLEISYLYRILRPSINNVSMYLKGFRSDFLSLKITIIFLNKFADTTSG